MDTPQAIATLHVSPAPPVTISWCEPLMVTGTKTPPRPDSYSGRMLVRFIDTDARAVTSVVIRFSSDFGYTDQNSSGKFSPNVVIEHKMRAPAGRCAIQNVTFSDGTSWQAASHNQVETSEDSTPDK